MTVAATHATEPRESRGANSRRASGPSAEIDWAGLDARVLATFEDKLLLRELHRLEKVELASVRIMTERALSRHERTSLEPVAPFEVHRRLLAGSSGESLLVSSSMFLDTLQEAEHFFRMSFKTIKSKLGRTLDPGTSELAMRAARATTAAAEVLGSLDAARRYSLPTNWNQRPVARNSQRIGREFLMRVDERLAGGQLVCGVRVPSVISSTDCNVLLDPRRKSRYSVTRWSRGPFDWLRDTPTRARRVVPAR